MDDFAKRPERIIWDNDYAHRLVLVKMRTASDPDPGTRGKKQLGWGFRKVTTLG
jgi:hypothetical protein